MSTRGPKPEKPYKGYPLFAHAGGVWACKHKGKFHYFGPWADPQGALKRYEEEWPYIFIGKTPPGKKLTVADVLNAFLGEKKTHFDSGDISDATYKEYEAACDVIDEALGKTRDVETLDRDDFTKLRTAMSTGKRGRAYSPVTLKRRLTIARMVFAFANEELDQSLRYKKALQAPSTLSIRRKEREREKRLFEAADIRALVKAADPHLKAMILLGINCGFGPRDCCTLPASAVDLEGGWHNYPRPKTEVDRRCSLWPETIKALKAVIGSKHVFNGRQWNRWLVAREFEKICDAAKVTKHGFYSLRRTFETMATTADVSQAIIDAIMGHSRQDMASVYRQKVFDDQLRKCTDHVRLWYLGKVKIQ